MENKPVVTITGVSGYLGSHVCLYFLKSGEFKVRGTVRSKTNAKKIEPLRKAFGEYFDQLELIEADLLDKPSLIQACEGTDYVVHTASPVPVEQPKNPEEVFRPAIDGTLGVLEGCRKYKVKRCVYTSSIVAALVHKQILPRYDGNTWSDPTVGNPYLQSKSKAEKAAWDYVNNLPANERFEFATVLPGLVLGPVLMGGEHYSASTAKAFMMGTMPGCPKCQAFPIDVRDSAEVHFKALTVPEAAGKRFLNLGSPAFYGDIGKILHAKYGKHYKVVHQDMRKCMVWIGSFFDAQAKLLLDNWGKTLNVDNSDVAATLRVKYTPLDKTMEDMVESMIEFGVIPEQRK